MVSSNN